MSGSKKLQICHTFKHITQDNLLLLEGFWLGAVLLTIWGGGGGGKGVKRFSRDTVIHTQSWRYCSLEFKLTKLCLKKNYSI